MVNTQVEGAKWPIYLLEQDGYPVVVATAAELSTAYEPSMWDEASAAFDSGGREITLQGIPGHVVIATLGSEPLYFVALTQRALILYARDGRWKRAVATSDETDRMLRRAPQDFMNDLSARFGAEAS